jgi:hypothetical protein
MALVKPLHSGDPDVMRNSHAVTCIRSDLLAYVTRNRIQARSPIVTWGGDVAKQSEIPNGNKYGHSNGSFHRVLACSAGGPGFDSRLRHNILRCSMQKDVDGSGQASTTVCFWCILCVRYSGPIFQISLQIQKNAVESLCPVYPGQEPTKIVCAFCRRVILNTGLS